MFHRAVNNLSFLARHVFWLVGTAHIRHPVFLSDLLMLLRKLSFCTHSLVKFFISFGSRAKSSRNVPLYRITASKVSKYRVFYGPYFAAFGLNSDRYGVSLRIKSECGKIRTSKNSVFGHFSRSEWDLESWQHQRQRFLWQ